MGTFAALVWARAAKVPAFPWIRFGYTDLSGPRFNRIEALAGLRPSPTRHLRTRCFLPTRQLKPPRWQSLAQPSAATKVSVAAGSSPPRATRYRKPSGVGAVGAPTRSALGRQRGCRQRGPQSFSIGGGGCASPSRSDLRSKVGGTDWLRAAVTSAPLREPFRLLTLLCLERLIQRAAVASSRGRWSLFNLVAPPEAQ
jgi:hypothetical protein